MTKLNWETENGKIGVRHYLSFFDKLTQVIVLKTIDIDAESICHSDLENFLDNGNLK